MRPFPHLAAPILGLLALAVVAPAAHADPGAPGAPGDPVVDAIGLSPDGRQYSSALEGPLFRESLLWVPGDRRTTSWWVRNQAPDLARLAVEVPEDADLPGWLAVEASTGEGWAPVTDGGFDGGTLTPGAVRRVVLRVSMRAGAGDPTMREAADLRLRVRLSEEEGSGSGDGADDDGRSDEDPGGGGGPPGDDDGRGGLLPGTGSDLGLLLLLVALSMVGLGIALLRRRPEGDDEEPSHEPDREREEVAS